MRKYFMLLLLIFIMGCGASTQYIMQDKSIKLKQFNNIYVVLKTAGAMSIPSTTMAAGGATVQDRSILAGGGALSSDHIMSGDRQGQIALEKFKFELAKIGFNVVNDPQQADAYVDFSIGTIRSDPIAGWIADQAIVKFVNKNDKQTIGYFTADGRFITPTVNNIIKNLSKSIKKKY